MAARIKNDPSTAYIQEFYPFDPVTHQVTICVAVDRYDGIFNPIDPSPLRQRDISPYFREYIEECSAEIPSEYPIEVHIQVDQESQNLASEQEVSGCVRHFFQFQLHLCNEEIRSVVRKAVKYSLIAVACLVLSYSLPELPHLVLGTRLLVEGLTIGGWVFLWEAIADLFISTDPIRTRKAHLKRLVQSPIRFTYSQPPA